ncbi:25S rRNA (uridine(2843)-N(3))-methyltransferase [Paramyrothecium foliicola]|nr:25S rRNA (uridine(2843)-N(3))-methyltransferase [Paramyrothecium foliicola]
MVRKQPASKKPPRSGPAPAPAPSAPATGADDEAQTGLQLDRADQQRILNIFKDVFGPLLESSSFSVLLQEIKQALFNRDFAGAFGKEEYLEAYAARWSPTRALCYATIFLRLSRHIGELSDSAEARNVTPAPSGNDRDSAAEDTSMEKSTSSGQSCGLRMLSVGGCAAEHVAFAAYLRSVASRGHLSLLDSAPWAHVTNTVQTQITSPPTLSKYASAAVRSANRPLLEPAALSVEFIQRNVLDLSNSELAGVLGTQPIILTLLFTLNELYTVEGLGKTTKLLKCLGELMAPGSLLLVVDSPGSYSEAAIGTEQKRYPMQWLLHHTLVETETIDYSWERLESEDSTWFRLPEDLTYPIPLENMRYQLHLYQLRKGQA